MSTLLNILGAGLVSVVGLALLAARVRRPGSTIFGLVLLTWSWSSIFNYLLIYGDTFVYLPALVLGTALKIFLVLLVVRFAIALTRTRTIAARIAYGATSAFVCAVALLFLVRPGALLLFDAEPGSVAGTPAIAYLVDIPAEVAFYGAWLAILAAFARTVDPLERAELGIVAAGLGAYLAYHGPFLLLTLLASFGLSIVLQFVYAPVWIGATGVILGSVAWLRARRWRGDAFDKAILGCVAAGLGLAIVTAAYAYASPGFFGASGIMRIVAALVIAYGILKHHVFGIDLKLKWTLGRGAVLAAFGAVFFVADQATQYFVAESYGVAAGFGAALLLILALRPLERRARRLADRVFPGVEPTQTYYDARKLVVYRAAAVAAAKDGMVTAREREMLDALVRELEIPAAEAQSVDREVFGAGAATPA